MKKFSIVFGLMVAFLMVGCTTPATEEVTEVEESPVEEQVKVSTESEEVSEEVEKPEMAGDDYFPGVAANYEVDTAGSILEWEGCKVTGCHNGDMTIESGMVMTDENGMLTDAEFVIDMTSIYVRDLSGKAAEGLLKHLNSDDFFGVETYPTAVLEITEIEAKGNNTYEAEGVFEMKGIKNEVEFEFSANKGNLSTERIIMGNIELDRTLWGVQYGSGKFFDDLGDSMIDDTFTLGLDVVLRVKK